MSAYAHRQKRYPVWLPARMKWHDDWSDFTIGNVSGGGIMGMCDHPPPRGETIELQYGNWLVTARVAWSAGDRFGAQSSRPITFDDLLCAGQLSWRTRGACNLSLPCGSRPFLSDTQTPPAVLTAPKFETAPATAMLAALAALLALLLYMEAVRRHDERPGFAHAEPAMAFKQGARLVKKPLPEDERKQP